MDLPDNSNIDKRIHNGSDEIVISHGNGGFMKYFIAAFLVFWLCGWAVGFVTSLTEILTGEGNAFLVFWLCGWTVGGGFAGFFLYRIVRKSAPERLLLNKPSLAFDSGVPPFKMQFGFQTPSQQWASIFPKRKVVEFSHSEMNSLKLRETGSGNRLTIDSGSNRVEIALNATEIEREWLYEYLTSNYS